MRAKRPRVLLQGRNVCNLLFFRLCYCNGLNARNSLFSFHGKTSLSGIPHHQLSKLVHRERSCLLERHGFKRRQVRWILTDPKPHKIKRGRRWAKRFGRHIIARIMNDQIRGVKIYNHINRNDRRRTDQTIRTDRKSHARRAAVALDQRFWGIGDPFTRNPLFWLGNMWGYNDSRYQIFR